MLVDLLGVLLRRAERIQEGKNKGGGVCFIYPTGVRGPTCLYIGGEGLRFRI